MASVHPVAMPMQPQVITQQPGVPGYVATVVPQTRDWSSGLCDCCKNPTSCLCSFFFAQCYTCHILSRMGENCCVGWLCPFPSALVPMRAKMRGQYGIEGGLCNDICTSWWCAPCVLAQLSREIDYVNGQSMVRQ